MGSANESRPRGLEDLRWQSLTRPERLLVAALIERAADAPAFAHLEDVSYELRESAQTATGVPLVLTERQNKAIARALEEQAQRLERQSERPDAPPALARSAQYAAGYLRSLLDRLVRGRAADRDAALERVLRLLLLDVPRAETSADLEGKMIRASDARLGALGVGGAFLPVLRAYAPEAAAAAPERARIAAPLDDPAWELETGDDTAQGRTLAGAVFEASLAALSEGEHRWSPFLVELREGRLPGCEAAAKDPQVALRAAGAAREIVGALRRHLAEMDGCPWEAASPGLEAVLGAYPALSRHAGLRAFAQAEARKHTFRSRGEG